MNLPKYKSQTDKKPSDDMERVPVAQAVFEAVKCGDRFKGKFVFGKAIAGKLFYLQVEKGA